MFMPSSGSLKPESSVKPCRLFQIVDTPESSETPLNTVRCDTPQKTNRTVVIMSPYSPDSPEPLITSGVPAGPYVGNVTQFSDATRPLIAKNAMNGAQRGIL
jgi:hypothetical protein